MGGWEQHFSSKNGFSRERVDGDMIVDIVKLFV